MILEGRFVTHNSDFYGQVLIGKNGMISRIGKHLGRADFIYPNDCVIFPGFVDVHVHAREDASGMHNYKEDFRTASEAAISGGVVCIADMPNNPIAPSDCKLYNKKKVLAASSLIPVILYAAIGPGTKPLDVDVPYKTFIGRSTEAMTFASLSDMEEAIKLYAGRSISFHCEDQGVMDRNKNAAAHEQRRPEEAEIKAVAYALRLIKDYRLSGRVCHISTEEGLKLVAGAKRMGLNVSSEATPHHLYFDEQMLNEKNRLWLQMNPPLRGRSDRLALINGLKSGIIDYLATDHAPHTREEKLAGISGVPHLDTYGAFTTWLMAEHGFKPQDIARVCSYNPGRFVNQFLPKGPCFGEIRKGYAGSFTVISLHNPTKVSSRSLKTRCGWSPFENLEFPGNVAATIVFGKIYNHHRVVT